MFRKSVTTVPTRKVPIAKWKTIKERGRSRYLNRPKESNGKVEIEVQGEEEAGLLEDAVIVEKGVYREGRRLISLNIL